ncbi:MAG TPA: hypothetical protein VNK96_04995 [Fimbriimonadales bacterium]|nr:hypothetical protein [Fimbriimonadales bacterium]
MPTNVIVLPLGATLSILSTYFGNLQQGSQVAPQNPNYFNPQISVVGDTRYVLQNEIDQENERASIEEIEVGLAADADPFLRVEAYITFGEEEKENGEREPEAEIEEVFGWYTNLGAGFQAKAGKLAAAIGRVNRNHKDQLNYLDFPFVITDFFGEEGFRAPGISISYLFPMEHYLEIALETLDPHESTLFAGTGTSKPVWVSHIRTFFDFSNDLSAQLGLSYANGPSVTEGKRAQIYGTDWTMKWQPGIVGKSIELETEAYWAKSGIPGDSTKFGTFASLTYQVAPRWFVLGKYDYSEIPGTQNIRKAWTVGVTNKITEFHHWRFQWQNVDSNFDASGNVFTLQFQWIIGVHPAHKY